ncbi:Dipeptidyl carboxypeptidase Dcp [Rubellimicrobium mesophilum DSM 19309]|uniref:Dipeptidyl carboxypeptidase Dcp n=1 Tax=Rubellimicrobium mesophilum DSM 19309 TaxID=442562 RepID=A0A017HRQ5_9RHOB|nr:M3 family metallopeptidase [Rubellimicrobium mesophilum]EYD77000.1 Dipeptidyl carboxypeptidase Dcp [Rubellimicrobium mesophilum DSM 19309]
MNPLLTDWTTPFGLPPFDLIRDEDYGPAVDAALEEARGNIRGIAESGDEPTFQNTIAALEQADQRLSKVLGAFWAVAGADTNDARQALERELAPKLSAYGSEITSNKQLFARIDDLWERRESLGLSPEEERVLYLTHRGFVRSGAQLDGQEAERMKEVKARLAVLGTQFSQNVLADEKDWVMPLSEEDLEGLPDFVVQAARAAGEAKGAGGPVVTLSRSLIVPFLQFSPKRDLRKRAYEAWVARGANGGATDNRGIAAEMLKLREERAKLLGFPSFADWKLETEMARTPQAVKDLLMAVWEPAKKAAEIDVIELALRLWADGQPGPFEPWDWRYYAEKRRAEEHEIDEGEVKAFFQLDRMIAAAFDVSRRLFRLEFREIEGPRYHPDVRMWEVTRDGSHVAVFVGDYFAREGKRSGAWCSAMRSQSRLGGEVRPIVVNVCNFAKPPEGEPALLSWDDARTLFHEFGHALHQMLSNVTFESVSGTSTARDFVELPSQLYEHWLEVPEVLETHAVNAAGEPMPGDLRERLLAARTFDMGFNTVEYVASALVDMAFHDGPAPADPMQREAEVLEALGMPHAIRMRHATPHFQHVFSGDGYSAGYYSYMWSEVMDADAFAAFEEAGSAFDPRLAERLEREILSVGGSRDEGESYLAFRGRMPGVEALLRGRGLRPEAA